MRKVAQATRKVVRQMPVVMELLGGGMANISEIARKIRPKVRQELLKPVSVESVAMALRRLDLAVRPKRRMVRPKSRQGLTLRSGLVEFIVPASVPVDKVVKSVSVPESVIAVSRGMFESIIVVHRTAAPLVRKALGKRSVKTVQNLSAIMLRLPKESIETPGSYYPMLQLLAWENVNFLEIISIGSELTFLFSAAEAERAFPLLSELLQSG